MKKLFLFPLLVSMAFGAIKTPINNGVLQSNLDAAGFSIIGLPANQINLELPSQTGNSGKYLTTDGSVPSWATISSTGTVTSVALTLPGLLYSVTGSPITTSGTFAFSLNTQAAHSFLAGPTSGGAATPTMRAIVLTDLPNGTGTVTSVSGTAPISVATGTSTPVISIVAATTSVPGSMSAADKTKLDAISGTNTGDQVVPTDTSATAANFFTAYNSATGIFTKAQPTFANLASTPTTRSGYGITDAAASGANTDITSLGATTSVTSSGALTLAAGGSNQSIILTPSGTGKIRADAGIQIGGTTSAYGLLLHSASWDNILGKADGSSGALELAVGGIDVLSGTNRVSFISGTTFAGASAGGFGIGSSATDANTVDVKLSRNAAGVFEVNSGTPGTFRDFKARYYYTSVTNDASQAGTIGEYVSASVVQGSAAALTTATPKTITSISLTAGNWDITAIGAITGASTGTEFDVAIGTTTNSMTGTVLGDSRCQTPTVSLAGADATLMIPALRVSISSTTTYYLIVQETFTVGSPAAYGRISATRPR